MIKYLKHSYIDRNKYDQCINLDDSKLVYGLSWYLDLVCESWDLLVLNDYDAVWPLPVREKLGIKYFYRPYAVQQLGIFSKKKINQEQTHEFLTLFAKSSKFADVYANQGQFNQLAYKGISVEINNNFVLGLKESYEHVYSRYSKNTKRNIKKSQAHNFTLFEKDSPEALIKLFKSNQGLKLKLKEAFYRSMEKVMFAALHKNIGQLWTLYNERNELCAGFFMIEFRGRNIMLFSAANAEAKSLGAMAHLINEFIIMKCGRAEMLDFEGSNNEGLARFYKGFGSLNLSYSNLKFNNLPLLFKWLK